MERASADQGVAVIDHMIHAPMTEVEYPGLSMQFTNVALSMIN